MDPPPSTANVDALTKPDSSDAKNTAIAATSSGKPKRPNVVLSMNSSTTPGASKKPPVAGVWIRPGAMALTRMPRGDSHRCTAAHVPDAALRATASHTNTALCPSTNVGYVGTGDGPPATMSA